MFNIFVVHHTILSLMMKPNCLQTFSNALTTGKEDEGDVQTKLFRFLLSYRTITRLPD